MSEETKPTPIKELLKELRNAQSEHAINYEINAELFDEILSAVNQSDHVKILVNSVERYISEKENLSPDLTMIRSRFIEMKRALAHYRRATEGL
jgi:alpha-L-fucosidase